MPSSLKALACPTANTDFSAVLKRTHTARGVETHFQYDTLNRLTKTWYTGLGGLDDPNASRPALPTEVAATSDVTISYNTAAPGNGQVTQVTDGSGTESYGYDSIGRTTSKTRAIDGNSYQTQYQYNQASQLTLLIYPSTKRVRMNHDSRGRFSGEDKVDTAGTVLSKYVRSVAYNVAGQVTGMGIGEVGTNAVITETYGYSADRLQLTSQTAVNNGGSQLMSVTYGYQAAAGASGTGTTAGNSGQLMGITGTINSVGRNETYTYDDLARLASAGGYYAQRNYSYDKWGNRTAVSGGSSQSVTMQQPGGGVTNNRIASVNGLTYSYDAAGNLTWDGVHSYKYDAAGRIANVDTTGASYSYDFANQRLKKVVGTGANAVTTYYMWEGGQVIAEYSNATAGAGGTSYYLADKLSTRMTTDSNGAFKGTQDHLPFGEEGSTSGTSEKHRFTNYERDAESGTDYAVNRQYSMGTGRFMRPDPIEGNISVPQSLNRYPYTSNDPINADDPMGLQQSYPLCTELVDGKIVYVPCPTTLPPVDPNDPLITLSVTEFANLNWLLRWNWSSMAGPFGPAERISVSINPSIIRIAPPSRQDTSVKAVSSALSVCGTGATIGQYSSVNAAGTAWRGMNGQWNRMGWGGNGSTGARSL